MTSDTRAIWRVAVLSPLRSAFDYLPPADLSAAFPAPGVRVRVPFGRGHRVGMLLGYAGQSEVSDARLKRVAEIIDEQPIIDQAYLELLHWTADYYLHPIGEVVFSAMPPAVRRGRALPDPGLSGWRLNAAGEAADNALLSRAPRQRALLAELRRAGPQGLAEEQLAAISPRWQAPVTALKKRGWVERVRVAVRCSPCQPASCPRALNPDQRAAVAQVFAASGSFASFLLHGVTGSGKTEVYLELIEALSSKGKQALVMIPEIGLTPQIVARFRARLHQSVVVLHSGLSQGARLSAWRAARDGRASVIIGTRSAVFTPLLKPGLFIVDEEQDASYKQQDGLRYSARDLAVVRARMSQAPVILGSATPSLETVHNVRSGRYTELRLPERAGDALQPSLEVIDLRGRRLEAGLSEPLIDSLQGCLENREQAILFINRRGFAPAYLCQDCGWVSECRRCDAKMVLHMTDDMLLCHHCGSKSRPPASCPECGGDRIRLPGLGTERVAGFLTDRFPGARISRIDRDSTRRKGAFETLLESMHGGEIDIVVGTQMVAKGHHFPNVTLVGVVDADSGLFGVDFRAGERMAQLLLQVAGRAGRGDKPGRVMIQTHHPDHPLLNALVTSGYGDFAVNALEERAQAGLPPYSFMALLRAEATAPEACDQFLKAAHSLGAASAPKGVRMLGPVPAPMARRAGRYRAQLFIESSQRAALHRFLRPWVSALDTLPQGRKVRWSLDVDPQDIL